MLGLATVTIKPGLIRACYLDAGRHFAALRHNRDQREWSEIVRAECGMSPRRAYQLMAVATGSKALETLRLEDSNRHKKHRKNKAVGRKRG